jgi:hypothetical protein
MRVLRFTFWEWVVDLVKSFLRQDHTNSGVVGPNKGGECFGLELDNGVKRWFKGRGTSKIPVDVAIVQWWGRS